MSKEIETFDPSKLSELVLAAARGCEGSVSELMTRLAWECPERDFSRSQARELLRYVTLESEADELASTPSSEEVIDRRIGRALYEDVARIERENRILAIIAGRSPMNDYTIGDTEETINPQDAKGRMEANTNRLLKIKAAISASVKAKAGDAGGVNVNVNLGNVLSEALASIKEIEVQEKTLDALPAVAMIPVPDQECE